jgi:hypothetical protein
MVEKREGQNFLRNQEFKTAGDSFRNVEDVGAYNSPQNNG